MIRGWSWGDFFGALSDFQEQNIIALRLNSEEELCKFSIEIGMNFR
jgi:hypothetical protein